MVLSLPEASSPWRTSSPPKVSWPGGLCGVVGDGVAEGRGVYLGLPLYGFFDLGLPLVRLDLRRDDDVLAEAHHAARVLAHPLDLNPLVLPFHLPVERYPPG